MNQQQMERQLEQYRAFVPRRLEIEPKFSAGAPDGEREKAERAAVIRRGYLVRDRDSHSCFVDSSDAPKWVRTMGGYAMDRFRANARNGAHAEDVIPAELQGQGRGKRAVNFQFAMQLDPRILSGSQSFSNCTSWGTRECVGCCTAVDIVANAEAHAYVARPGTAGIYAYRGSRSDAGMALADAANVVHNIGIAVETKYPGYDLSTEDLDERAGVAWGGSGMPKGLIELVKGNLIEQVSEVVEEDAVLDLLHAGHFMITGSTRTAGGPGDPVSSVGPVGAHCQGLLGFDDTDEFRELYKKTTGKTLTDWVGILDQSWGDWLRVTNWPDQLWGPRPEGAFVLRGRDVVSMIRQWGSAFAFSKVKGFPLLNLPDWGSYQYL